MRVILRLGSAQHNAHVMGWGLQPLPAPQARHLDWLAKLVGFFLIEDCVDRAVCVAGGLQVAVVQLQTCLLARCLCSQHVAL